MKEIKYIKTESRFTFLQIPGIALLVLIIQTSTVVAEPSENITFVTAGSSFSPIITVTGNPAILWTFGDGSTSSSPSPVVNFGSSGTRVNTLVVTPWSAVTKINLGYDGSDEGVAPGPNTIASLKQQNVIAVSGLENVAPYLQVWASNSNPIIALDFSNFIALNTVECFACRSLADIKLRNVPSLTRLCVEQCNISYLDLSEAPALADLRGASQHSPSYTINWGTTGSNIWHSCTRDNPRMTSTFPYNQFQNIVEFYNWNDNQTGTLILTSTSLDDVLSADNHYKAAVLSGCFPAGRGGEVDISNNDLTSLDISNDPGLLHLNASRNYLNQAEVDEILQTLDSYNTRGGFLDLTGNAAPSDIGIKYANNLTSRQWDVEVSSKNNQPSANFTCNVTSGTVPLTVQFNDISINSPAMWSWDFGDNTYSTEESPTHVYTSPGNYTVFLGIRNAYGSDFKVASITAQEQPVLPVADFSCSASEGRVPLDVQFYDLSKNTTERSWDFGDGTNSTEENPKHTYSVVGSYSANLTVKNANGTDSKTVTIDVLDLIGSVSDGSTNSGGSSSGGGSGGGAGGSPEPQSNVEVKELSQSFITNGQTVKFEFPQRVTAVESISFDSMKTVGKTTTIVEMLKNKSTQVSGIPSDEVYKYENIWVGNSGFAAEKNIGNAIVAFKVAKSWVQDKKIDKYSITLNRYIDNSWSSLSTTLLNEDDNYLYFSAKTSGFSYFAITGKSTATGSVQPAGEKTENATESKAQNKISNLSTAANTENNSGQKESPSPSPKQSAKTPGFEALYAIFSLLAVLIIRQGTHR